jgi:Holliday junction resolvase RusA-like endonuclease
MIKIFEMSVDIKPIPASRPRVTKFGTYNAKPYLDYKKALQTLIKLHKTKKIGESDKPIFLKAFFTFEKPKSWTKIKKANTYYHTLKPDTDNLIKAVKDAMSGIIYKDDSQVAYLDAHKVYGEKNNLFVEVYEL